MKKSLLTTAFYVILLLLTSCEDPSKAVPLVSYSNHVAPILQTHCLKCHNKNGEGYVKSGLNMETYSTLMAGTKFGPIINPGNSLTSNLVILINGKADPAISMPHGSLHMLTESERDTVALWIDQGAKEN
jgi:uncharacterized membrane protein